MTKRLKQWILVHLSMVLALFGWYPFLQTISGGSAIDDVEAAYQAELAQAKVNNDLLDSITSFLGTVAGIITQNITLANSLATADAKFASLSTSMNALAATMKEKDDLAAAALVSATPAAAPSVTPPGPEPISPPANG